MRVNGTMINYYYHCKRQCYLFSNRINLEDNSEDVRIGKVLHELKLEEKSNTEIKLDNISIDKITDKYVIEVKKSDSDIQAARIQVLLYLKKLEEKGIRRIGKLVFHEKNSNESVELIELNDKSREELNNCVKEINILLESDIPPLPQIKKSCKKCAYYEYCYL